MKKITVFLLLILFAFNAFANNKLPQTGEASYYGDRVNHHRVACGERYCKDSFTAAHRTLPFGTFLKVTNLGNGKTVIVRINDRGPRKKKRIIDLSGAAADRLGMRQAGLARVRIELASTSEIAAQQKGISDSIAKDSLAACKPLKIDSSFIESFMVQGGAYSYEKYALVIKNYLADSGITHVVIRKKKARRHYLYKVIIGPVDLTEKEKVLRILRYKNISGLVIRL
jgi:rare lipoprotein A